MRTKLAMLALCGLCACGGGGGGGGSDTKSYAGTWHFMGTISEDNCGMAPYLPSVETANVVVNQDGEDVALQSGSVSFTGKTNPWDGFTVSATINQSGCMMPATYDFEHASDGDADVTMTLTDPCNSRTCTVAYSGSANLVSDKVVTIADDGFDNLIATFAAAAASK